MKDFQRGWYIQLLLMCARSKRVGYLPLDERLWALAGAHRREMWEQHNSAVMACFKTRTFDGLVWIYNERLLRTIEEQTSRSKSMIGNKNAANRKKQCPSISFVVPSFEEVSTYCKERNNNINAQEFCDFYASKGWKVGNQAMKDWRAAVRTWEGRHSGENRRNHSAQRTNAAIDRYHNNQLRKQELKQELLGMVGQGDGDGSGYAPRLSTGSTPALEGRTK